MRPTATELEFLQWFFGECDFGPAHEDVMDMYRENFVFETGKGIPIGYGKEDLETSEEEET